VTESSTIDLSIVVPVYNEVGNINEFLTRIIPILVENVETYEIIFSVDPSTDGTENLIEKAHNLNPNIKMIKFSRRFGQPTATLAGLDFCSGRAALVMDVDLQDPPELIPELLTKWKEGFAVVYAKRRHRDGETWLKKLTSKVGYGLIDRFGDVKIPRDTGDFRLIDRIVIDELKRFPETHGFLRGLVALVGYKQTEVIFDRPARHSGKGNYNRFFGSFKIGLNGIIGFSSALLNLSTVLGFLAAITSFILGASYVVLQLFGQPFPVGNPSIVAVVLFVGGLQLICLGIIGQYIGRIYDEVKHRPRYIVSQLVGLSH
jgi:glycosyltransferase involved in cell wall biosynthesis